MSSIAKFFIFTMVSVSFSLANIDTVNVPDAGRCTAAAFGHSEGNRAATPGTGGQGLDIQGLSATKGNSSVTLQFQGITAEVEDDLVDLETGDSILLGQRAFYQVYRCDARASSGTVWEPLITEADVEANPGTFSMNVVASDSLVQLQFVDNFTGVTGGPVSEYYYGVVAFFYDNDNSFTPEPFAFTTGLTDFDNGTTGSLRSWSKLYAQRVSYAPEQPHVVYNSSDSSNFSTDVNGFVVPASTPALASTTLGETVSYTFTTTAEASAIAATPSFAFTYSVVHSDGSTGLEDLLTFTPTGDSLEVSGTIPTNNADVKPGTYTLTVSATIDSNTTVSEDFTWSIAPRPVDLNPSSGVVQNVEIGFNEDFTISRIQGFSEPSLSNFVTLSWSISNVSTTSLVITPTSTTTTGDSATFNAALPDVEALAGLLPTFDVTLTETCNPGAPNYCAGMVGTVTKTLQIQALGHDFNFSSANRSTEAAQDLSDPDTFVPVYFNSNQQNIIDFTTYPFQAVNMKAADQSPLTSASFSITSFLRNGSTQTITGTSVSAGGVTVSTPPADTSDTATLTVDSAALTPNDTFVVTITAHNSAASTPESTSVTIAFIALEAVAPTVTASAIYDDLTGSAFDWPGGFSSAAFPARTDARLSITFSENVTNPSLQFPAGDSVMAFDNAGTTGTSFSKVLTSGVLLAALGSNATSNVGVLFSGAIDQNNIVKKNLMLDPGQFIVTLAQTPDISAHTTGPLKRNDTISITLTENITGVNSGAFEQTNLNGFSVTIGDLANTINVSPLPGRDLATNNSASLTVQPGGFFNSGGYPNVTTNVIDLTFLADTTSPVLQSSSFESSDFLTNVTYVLKFNEDLAVDATVTVTNITDGSSFSFTATRGTPSNNSLTISTAAGLVGDKEYQFIVTGIADAATNATTVALQPFITFGAGAQAEIDMVKAAKDSDKTSPSVLAISPDFRLPSNQVNQPLRPVISVTFSELMAPSTEGSILLSTTAGASTGLPLTVEYFDGLTLVVYPTNDLQTGTDYWINFNLANALDLRNNTLEQVSYKFTTFNPVANTNVAPEHLGNNLTTSIERNTKPRFYFSEPVNVASLDTAIYIKTGANVGSGTAVSGSWSSDGSDALFNTDGLVAGASYNYMIWTSNVADLLGKTNPLGASVSGVFTVEGDTAIRGFSVRAVDSGNSTLAVSASWLPPIDKSAVTSYTLSYETLDSNYNVNSSPTELTTAAANAARYSADAEITGFTAGNSYKFTITANGSNESDSVDVTAIPAQANTIGTTLVSILADTATEVGSDNAKAKVTIKPGDLKNSANITVGFIDNPALKNQNGGGSRHSDIIQLEPHGITFNKPVDFALKIENALSSIAQSCATSLDTTCEVDLLSVLNPLTFDAANKEWTRKALSKTRVEVLDENNALLHARTPHFSAFVVAQAFTFATSAPANSSNLSTATIGQTTYLVDIPLTGTPNSQIAAVTFSPDTFGFTGTFSGDNIRIANSDVFRVPTETADSVSVTITVTDVSSDTTETRVFTIPILDLNGDPEFKGNPVPVDFFKVYLSTDTTANLSWGITSDTTDRTIDIVNIAYRDLTVSNGATTLLTFGRGVSSNIVSGLAAGHNYSWNIYTKSAQGNRSLATGDIERFTYGFEQVQVTDGPQPLSAPGVTNITIDVDGIGGGESLAVSQYSAADILNETGVGGILTSTTTLRAPYGTVEFIDGTLMDLNFSGSSASVSYTVDQTGNFAVYHYVLNSNGSGAWEELPTAIVTGVTLAGLVEDGACGTGIPATSSCVTIISAGAGSPFAVGPKLAAPLVIRSGGGGCSVVEGVETNTASGLLNLLLMLLPLGLIIFRKLK